jgi:hypothetical protein
LRKHCSTDQEQDESQSNYLYGFVHRASLLRRCWDNTMHRWPISVKNRSLRKTPIAVVPAKTVSP